MVVTFGDDPISSIDFSFIGGVIEMKLRFVLLVVIEFSFEKSGI